MLFGRYEGDLGGVLASRRQEGVCEVVESVGRMCIWLGVGLGCWR